MKEILRVFGILQSDGQLKWSRRIIYALFFFTVFGDFIANEKPVYCSLNGRVYSPMTRAMLVNAGIAQWPGDLASGQWRTMNFDKVVYTIIPYSPATLDSRNGQYRSPFGSQDVQSLRFRHWLGTDALGRDVLAGMIRGCRIAVLVGFLSMLLAMLIGVPFGAYAGYFGNDRVMLAWPGVILAIFLLALGTWYFAQAIDGFREREGRYWIYLLLIAFLGLLWSIHQKFLAPRYPQRWDVQIPYDAVSMRVVEIIRSIPALFILFGVLAVVEDPSVGAVVLIIGVLRAPTVMRYLRAEVMKLRGQAFVESALISGLTNSQVVWRHVVPNAMGPVFVTVAFGIAGAVLLESALSFLGIGLSVDQMSWGRLLSEARSNFNAWWLAVLPGVAIFLTVAAFNRVGEVLSDVFEGRLSA